MKPFVNSSFNSVGFLLMIILPSVLTGAVIEQGSFEEFEEWIETDGDIESILYEKNQKDSNCGDGLSGTGCRCCSNENDFKYPGTDQVCVPTFTPFKENGDLDLSVIDTYAAYLNSTLLNCVVVAGPYGEGFSLTLNERKAVLDKWMSLRKYYRLTVLAQIGFAVKKDVLSLARYAKKMNVDGIVLLPQLFPKLSLAEDLVSYVSQVAEVAFPVPIIFYYEPEIGGEVNMRKFVGLAEKQINNFKGVKVNLATALMIRDVVNKDVTIYADSYDIAAEVLLGFTSRISVTFNMFHNLTFAIRNAVLNKNLNKARVMQNKLDCILQNIYDQGSEILPLLKATMELITPVRVGPVRSTLTPVSLSQKQAICSILRGSEFECSNSAVESITFE